MCKSSGLREYPSGMQREPSYSLTEALLSCKPKEVFRSRRAQAAASLGSRKLRQPRERFRRRLCPAEMPVAADR